MARLRLDLDAINLTRLYATDPIELLEAIALEVEEEEDSYWEDERERERLRLENAPVVKLERVSSESEEDKMHPWDLDLSFLSERVVDESDEDDSDSDNYIDLNALLAQ